MNPVSSHPLLLSPLLSQRLQNPNPGCIYAKLRQATPLLCHFVGEGPFPKRLPGPHPITLPFKNCLLVDQRQLSRGGCLPLLLMTSALNYWTISSSPRFKSAAVFTFSFVSFSLHKSLFHQWSPVFNALLVRHSV